MKLNKKIREIRERNLWSQEEMAEKMNMSLNGYSKIERGETKLHFDKLEQIAQIFNMDLVELISADEKNLCFLINNNSQLSSNYYNSDKNNVEIDKLKLIINHKDEIIEKLQSEINALNKIIALLEK